MTYMLFFMLFAVGVMLCASKSMLLFAMLAWFASWATHASLGDGSSWQTLSALFYVDLIAVLMISFIKIDRLKKTLMIGVYIVALCSTVIHMGFAYLAQAVVDGTAPGLNNAFFISCYKFVHSSYGPLSVFLCYLLVMASTITGRRINGANDAIRTFMRNRTRLGRDRVSNRDLGEGKKCRREY